MSALQSGSSATYEDLNKLTELVGKLTDSVLIIKQDVAELQKAIILHDNELKERKVITNKYTDAILSKIEMLKNMIKQNVGDTEVFISPHLLEVEGIEEQIKSTGKISDKQFKTLNDIYLKQKRL